MKKRILAVLLCVCVFFGMLPFSASAEELTEEERICQQIRSVYRKTLYNTGRSSMNGVCGLMTCTQMWLLGINEWPETYDGNNIYDAYLRQEVTTGGYKVKTWAGTSYTLEEILNLITWGGTKDAYNLMVGFQRTTTNAGRIYGHAVLIHAILDGTVYFVEGFYTSLGGAEGNVIQCSIPEFCQLYADWTTFEGVVEFGQKVYSDFCECYPTNLFVCARDGAVILSQPCQVGENDCVQLRDTVCGERLHAVGVYKNDAGAYYYRLSDGDTAAYISVDAVEFDRINQGNVVAQDVSAPQNLEAGKTLLLTGAVLAKDSLIREQVLTVYGQDGSEVTTVTLPETGCMAKFSAVNRELGKLPLSEGVYTLALSANTSRYYVQDGVCQMRTDNIPVWQGQVTVGAPSAPVTNIQQESQIPEGWVFEDETWRYYQDGAPRVGWFCYEGVDYYFQPNGAVTTGWAEINGKYRLFTDTGAMRTGWVEAEQGVCYMLSNGVAATGWREVEGSLYCFDADGWMRTDQTAEYEGVAYYLQQNGVATTDIPVSE